MEIIKIDKNIKCISPDCENCQIYQNFEVGCTTKLYSLKGKTIYICDDGETPEEATEKRVVDEVMEMAKKHTLRPESFIRELKEKFGLK